MKLQTFIAMIVFCAVTVVAGCTNREESSTEATKEGAGKPKSAEVIAIENSISNLAKSMTDFPQTKDKQSVLKFATKDYVGIQDGEDANSKETEKYLSDLLERINLGEPIGISYHVTNINTHTSGITAWATYDFSYKLGSGGVPLEQMEGKCTAVLKKESDIWLFQHEHCSSDTTRQQRELQNAIMRGMLKK